MADFKLYFPILMEVEGGYGNDPDDHGGPTKYGVTLADWKAYGYDKDGDGIITAEDVKLITVDEAANLVEKPRYWDKMKADLIKTQGVAEVLVDFAYNSGVVTASKHIQRLLGVEGDGIVGPKTLASINSTNQISLFTKLKDDRVDFYLAIVDNNPIQKKFLKGWLHRLNRFNFR